MEKLILKRISAMLISIFIIISLSGTIGIFLFKNKVINKDIADMIFQIENTYEENKLNIEITKNFFLDDYFNKAYAVDYILSNNPDDNLNAESLKKIKELMEVETINILDKNGVVVLSSNHESIGLDLLNSKEAYPFWNLINGKDEEDKVAQLNAISIINKEEKIYIGIKASLEEYSIIQIGLDRSVYNDLIHIYSIEHLVNNIPTVYEKTIFAVDKNTGELCGLTKNNSEKIVLDDVNSKEEFRDKLYELTGGDVVKVNDKYMYMKTRIIDDYIVGAYIDLYSNYKLLSLNIIILIIGLITAFIVIILIVKKSINKYILNDVLNMEKNIIKLINGEYDIEFKTKYNTEIKRINFILNRLRNSYKYKSERMSRILSTMNLNSAIFECLYGINKNFFSNNIQEMLGISNDKWKDICESPDKFEEYIMSLEAKDGIVRINNRFLKIVSFKKEDEFYGIILDKTNDEEFKSKIKKESETDALTHLLNRKGLINRIRNISNENKDGILIMFDLDNFKIVNDELGHPVGDEVLKLFAKFLRNSFRKNDIISRIGGDEFIVYINKNIKIDTLSNKLNDILNKFRKELDYYYINYGLSISIGVTYKNQRNNTYEELYKEADEALYKSKKLGKDRFYIKDSN